MTKNAVKNPELEAFSRHISESKSVVISVAGDDLAKQNDFLDEDGIHGAVARLEAVMSVFLVELLTGGFVADECDDDVAVARIRGAFDDDGVTVHDACFDHAFAFDDQSKQIIDVVASLVDMVIDIAFKVFRCEDRLTCSNAAENGNVIRGVVFCFFNAECSGFAGFLLNIALFFQSSDVMVNGGGALHINGRCNVADGRGIAFAADGINNIIIYKLFFWG